MGTWKDCEGQARTEVAARCVGYMFQNTLVAVADYWQRVVNSDHSQPDKYAKNVHGFLACLALASKQWNDTARKHWPTDGRATIGHRTGNSTAVAAMDYFHDVQQVLLDAKAYGDNAVSTDQLKLFKQSMVGHFNEQGIPAKPAEVLGIQDCIEQQIGVEADSARYAQARNACTRIEHLRQQFLVVGDDVKLLHEAMTEGGLILVPLIETGTLWGNEVTQGYIDAIRKPAIPPWDNRLSEFSYQTLFQMWAMMFSDRQRTVLQTVSSSNGVTVQTTRTEDAKQQAHRYASFCAELVEFLSVPTAVSVTQQTGPATRASVTGTTPAADGVQPAERKRGPRTNPAKLRIKLDAAISKGYGYETIAKLTSRFGGSDGSWHRMIQEDATLKAWTENKSVQAERFGDVHTAVDDVFLPDDEMEKLFDNSLKELPAKDRPQAKAAFAKMDRDAKQRYVQEAC